MLEYNIKDGCEPVCQVLDVSVPDEPFPSQDDWVTPIRQCIQSSKVVKQLLKAAAIEG